MQKNVALALYLSSKSSTHGVTSGLGPSSNVRNMPSFSSGKFQMNVGNSFLMIFGGFILINAMFGLAKIIIKNYLCKIYFFPMCNIATFVKTVCLMILLFTFAGCKEEGVIDRKDMSAIIAEMFLVDQVLEGDNELRLQADSMLVYPAVMAKYGHTLEDFELSMKYYMNEGESYNDILKDARERLKKREKDLEKIIKEMRDIPYEVDFEEWWATDSVAVADPQEFLYDKLLRSVRWMVMRGKMKQEWKMLDSAIVDIPQNPQWWINTLMPGEREYRTIIIRDKDDSKKAVKRKKIGNNEKNSSELLIPIDRRTADKKRLSAPQRLR